MTKTTTVLLDKRFEDIAHDLYITRRGVSLQESEDFVSRIAAVSPDALDSLEKTLSNYITWSAYFSRYLCNELDESALALAVEILNGTK